MTFAIIFHVIFQKTLINEMDFDVRDFKEIDKEIRKHVM